MNVGVPLLRKLVFAQESAMTRLVLIVVYWAGLRRNELRNVQWRDVDLDGAALLITRRQRLVEIPLHAEAVDALRIYAAERKPGPTDYLLHHEKRYRRGTWPRYRWEAKPKPERQLSPEGVTRWWQRCVRNAGLEGLAMSAFHHVPGTPAAPAEPRLPEIPAERLLGGWQSRALTRAAAFLRRLADRLEARSRDLHAAAVARSVSDTAAVIAAHIVLTLRRVLPRER